MNKAEKAALEAYPNILFPFTPLDLNAYRREAFICGYGQAEKDLALTWKDIEEILIIDAELMEEAYVNKKLVLMQSHYEEILKRFNEYKSKKNESECM